MTLLITVNDIGKYREVSRGISSARVEPFIREAQQVDLLSHVCREFYDSLLLNWQEEKYQQLLDGGSYTYKGTNYHFEGLKAVLSYYAYSRLVMFGGVASTPWDMVNKTNEWSQTISSAQRRDIYQECRQIADKYWQDCKAYLDANRDDFPEWKMCGCATKSRLKIEKI